MYAKHITYRLALQLTFVFSSYTHSHLSLFALSLVEPFPCLTFLYTLFTFSDFLNFQFQIFKNFSKFINYSLNLLFSLPHIVGRFLDLCQCLLLNSSWTSWPDVRHSTHIIVIPSLSQPNPHPIQLYFQSLLVIQNCLLNRECTV